MIEQFEACHKALLLNPGDQEASDTVSQILMEKKQYRPLIFFYSKYSKLADWQKLINYLADEAAAETSPDKKSAIKSAIKSIKEAKLQRS